VIEMCSTEQNFTSPACSLWLFPVSAEPHAEKSALLFQVVFANVATASLAGMMAVGWV
jgi:hypothetical protein